MFETIRQTPAAAKIAQNTPQLNSNIDNLLRRRLSLFSEICWTRSKQTARIPLRSTGVPLLHTAIGFAYRLHGSQHPCKEKSPNPIAFLPRHSLSHNSAELPARRKPK